MLARPSILRQKSKTSAAAKSVNIAGPRLSKTKSLQQSEVQTQRYNQFRVNFDEQKLAQRQGYNRRICKLLLEKFPELYKFQLLILFTEIGERLILSEGELIYWYLVIKQYLEEIKNRSLATEARYKADGYLANWKERDLEEVMMLAGMCLKHMFVRAQSGKTQKGYHLNCQSDFAELQKEIESIEETLVQFHGFHDYQQKFDQLWSTFTFNLQKSCSTSEFNKLYKALSLPLNQQNIETDKKKAKSCLHQGDCATTQCNHCGESTKTQSVIDYNWEVDFILKNAQQYNKEPGAGATKKRQVKAQRKQK